MFKETYCVLGIMSGTSLDGVDIARINFTVANGKWHFKIYESATIPYSSDWLNKLKNAVHYSEAALSVLNQEYTEYLGKTIQSFIKKYNCEDLDAVCSHGHTVLHQPQAGITLQIGNLPSIASLVGTIVVCDFRVQDVQLGGQGAPLVPLGDRLLFSDFDYCLNLGGFSNISFEKDRKRVAFDITAVNTVLNWYANELGYVYDESGNLARNGSLNSALLEELDALPFYQKPHPKSLGIEWVHTSVLPIINRYDCSVTDKLHTFTHHIAKQTALALPEKKGTLLVSGGGAYHTFLIETLQACLPQMKIILPDAKVLEYKEALIFGLLGVLKLREEVNVLSSVTGAQRDHSSGQVYYPN